MSGAEARASAPAQDLSLREDITNFAGPPTQEEGRLYNPYEGLSSAVDPRVLRSVYKLPNQPEFLFSEEATVHRRSWSENLTYYTGTGYLAGLLLPDLKEASAPQCQLQAIVTCLTCHL